MSDWQIRVIIVLVTIPAFITSAVVAAWFGVCECWQDIKSAWKYPHNTRWGKK